MEYHPSEKCFPVAKKGIKLTLHLDIQSFLLILLISKIGFQVNESVTSLKLLEKGLSREDLAVAVLLDFPAQMIAGWLAAKWSRPSAAPSRHLLTQNQPTSQVLRPWVWAFWARLSMAAVAAGVVWAFPQGEISSSYFGLVIATTLLSSLARSAIAPTSRDLDTADNRLAALSNL